MPCLVISSTRRHWKNRKSQSDNLATQLKPKSTFPTSEKCLIDMDYEEYEKEAAQVLPHSESAEQALLGALLQDSTLIQDLPPGMDEDALYAARHRRIFRAIKHVTESGHRADPISVAERLSQVDNSDSEFEYLTDLVMNTSGSNVLAWSQIIINKKLDRDLINAGMLIQKSGYIGEESTEDKLAEAARLISSLDTGDTVEATDCNSLLKSTIDLLDKKFHGTAPQGLMTGFPDIDFKTEGWLGGELWVLAARPSMGKTALAMNIASNVAVAGGNVLVFSLEMPKTSLMNRLLSALGGINSRLIRSGKLKEGDWPILEVAARKLKDKDLTIIDKSGMNIKHACAVARKFNRHKKLSLIVVDYLQLFDGGKAENRTNEISAISRALKGLAKDTDTPVLALSQLNRGVETRANKRPVNADLRESGQIEQDADGIIFIYRDEFYNENSLEKGIAEIILGKNREGEVGTVRLVSQLEYSRFANLSKSYQPPPQEKKGFDYD